MPRTTDAVPDGSRLETVASGPGVAAVRIGRLVFATGEGSYVGAVLLSAPGAVSPLIALAGPACGTPFL